MERESDSLIRLPMDYRTALNSTYWLIAKHFALIYVNLDVYANGGITTGYWLDKIPVEHVGRAFEVVRYCFLTSRRDWKKNVKKLLLLFRSANNLHFIGKQLHLGKGHSSITVLHVRVLLFFFFFSILERRILERIVAENRRFHGVYYIITVSIIIHKNPRQRLTSETLIFFVLSFQSR